MNGFSAAQVIISPMITPALLILASGSLIATALVRLARVVDRVRKIAEPRDASADTEELHRHERQALLAERAVALYFFAVRCFVVAGFAIVVDRVFEGRLVWLPILATTVGMCLIVAGSAGMFMECRLAAAQIRAEITALITGAPLKG